MNKNFPVILIVIISLLTAVVGVSGCASPQKDSGQTVTEEAVKPVSENDAQALSDEAAQAGSESAAQAVTEEATQAGSESAAQAVTEEAAQAGSESSAYAVSENAVPASYGDTVQNSSETTARAASEMTARTDDEYTTLAEFTVPEDYQEWAREVGYPSNILVPMGVEGINQDYFHTLPDEPAYTSGRIVIGDSRCCQLGIYQQRTGAADFADYAVWAGHYLRGAEPPAMTGEILSDVEHCFQEQVKSCGKCRIYFFATVNDYDYIENDNNDYIAAAVETAEMLADLSFENEGRVSRPEIMVIGFDGGGGDVLYRTPADEYNRYINDYNEKLRTEINSSTLLKECSVEFTTVPEITEGSTGFIEDGLHYSDETLGEIVEFICRH